MSIVKCAHSATQNMRQHPPKKNIITKQQTSYILYQNKIIVTTRYNDILHCAIIIELYPLQRRERKRKKGARTTETDCA